MTPTGLAFMLGYVLPMTAWWLISGRLIGRSIPKSLVLVASSVGSLGPITFSLVRFGWPMSLHFWLLISGAIALNAIISYSYVAALERSGTAIGSHVTALVPLLVIISSWLLLGEKMGLMGMMGIVLIVSGVFVLNHNPGQQSSWRESVRTIWRKRQSWLWFALTVAVCKSIAAPLEKRCVQLTDAFLAPSIIVLLGWGVPSAIVVWQKRTTVKGTVTPRPSALTNLVLVAACLTTANVCQGIAYTHGFTASVESLKLCVQPLVVTITGLAFLFGHGKPQPFRYLVAGSLILTVGALLTGLSDAPTE